MLTHFGFLIVAVIHCLPAKRREVSNDHEAAEAGHFGSFAIPIQVHEDHHQHHHGGGGPTFSVGSGLKSIAQGSAEQANNAVLNQHAAQAALAVSITPR